MLLMFRNAEQRREGETNTRRESIVFYRSFFEAIRLQPKRIQAEIYNALLDYAFNGEEPDIGTAAMSIFYLIRPQIDANNMKYENGKKGTLQISDASAAAPKRMKRKAERALPCIFRWTMSLSRLSEDLLTCGSG